LAFRKNRRAPRHLKRRVKAEKIRRIGIILSVLVFSICAAALLIPRVRMQHEQRLFSRLAAQVASVPGSSGTRLPGQEPSLQLPDDPAEDLPEETETMEDILLRTYHSLSEKNPDMVGWLSVPGTDFSYPVMYTPQDGEYYLRRDFYGKASYSGTPFLDARCDMGSGSLFVHGHNLENGTMFEFLLSYQDCGYWQAHPKIRFDSLAELREYTVIGAFFTQIDEAHFPYYEYCGALDLQQFQEYVEQIQMQALYDTGNTAGFGDQLLTLSTCSYHAENGRFVLVAKRTA
jgi:sortase B